MTSPAEETPVAEPVKMEVEEPSHEELEINSKAIQDKANAYLVEQQKHVIVPLYSSWFDLAKINDIERKLFPDFFLVDSSSTGDLDSVSPYKNARVYQEIRDFIVNAYRVNPVEYLTVTAIRRNLAGDVALIIRIHQFLEKWGLINYQIDPRTKPVALGPQYTGHFQITLDTPTGFVPFLPKEINNKVSGTEGNEISASNGINESNSLDSVPLNLELRRNVYTKAAEAGKSVNVNVHQYLCNVCGSDCSQLRYHNLKSKLGSIHGPGGAAVLCISCYEQGLFPQTFFASDFVKLNATSDSLDSTLWSEQETLLLLEAVEMFGAYDNNNGGAGNSNTIGGGNVQWDKIADYVGTKSKEECLIKFVQLPIEDRYLNKLVSGKGDKGESQTTLGNTLQNIVSEIVSRSQAGENNGKAIKENIANKIDFVLKDQQSLISQIIELTLEKVDVKMSNLDILEKNLIEAQEKADAERRQFLYERWAQYEKVNKYKEEHPELGSILDELLAPVSISASGTANGALDGVEEAGKTEGASNGAADAVPVSVAQPKAYRFWSS